MRALVAVLYFALVTASVAPAASLVDPMRLTALCRWLPLIRVTEIDTISSEVSQGIERRHVIIKAELVEAVRGSFSRATFEFETDQFEVVDEAAAAKAADENNYSMLSMGILGNDVSSCREGGLYLVVTPDISGMSDMDFFYEIEENRKDWRRRIQALDTKVKQRGGIMTVPTPGDFDKVWSRFYLARYSNVSAVRELVASGAKMAPSVCLAVCDRKMRQRRDAISALGYFGDRRAILALETIYADSTEESHVRGAALRSLFCIDRKLGRLYARAVLRRDYPERDSLRRVAADVFEKPGGLLEIPTK